MLNYFFLNRVRILQHSIYRAYFTGLFNSNNALRLTDLCRNLHRSAIDIPLFHIPFFCKESIDIRSKTKKEDPEKYQAIIKFLKFYYGPEGTEIIAAENQSVPVTRYEGEIDADKYPVFARVIERMNDDWESPDTCPNMKLPGQFETTYFESMVGVINGIYTPEEALQFLDDQTEAQGIINK